MKTINRQLILRLTMMVLAVMLLTGCEKDKDLDLITDSDGNKYATVIIGGHYWMKENLRTLSYSDGSGILILQHDAFEWASASAACCIYDPDGVDGISSESDMRLNYGVLYNWYAVNSSTGVCPTGWRLPTREDWEELIAGLGGEDVAGGKMKGTKTDPDDHPRWMSPNTGATNASGFKAYPAGCRTSLGEFVDLGYYATWWTGSEYDSNFGVSFSIANDGAYIDYGYDKKRVGYSVRCIKED